jgi:hypothetical protein
MKSAWETVCDEIVEQLRDDLYRALVQNRTLTWAELARKSGVHVTTIQPFVQYPAGSNPTLKTLKALGRTLYEGC